MSRERQSRIALLSRAARGKIMLPHYLHALSKAIGVNINSSMLTELDERDSLFVAFRDGYTKAQSSPSGMFSETYGPVSKDTLFSSLSNFARCLNEPVLLLTKDSEFCGALQVDGRTALLHAYALLILDGDSVAAMSKDYSEGFLLDFVLEDTDSSYQLNIWGSRWLSIVMNLNSPAHGKQKYLSTWVTDS